MIIGRINYYQQIMCEFVLIIEWPEVSPIFSKKVVLLCIDILVTIPAKHLAPEHQQFAFVDRDSHNKISERPYVLFTIYLGVKRQHRWIIRMVFD